MPALKDQKDTLTRLLPSALGAVRLWGGGEGGVVSVSARDTVNLLRTLKDGSHTEA